VFFRLIRASLPRLLRLKGLLIASLHLPILPAIFVTVTVEEIKAAIPKLTLEQRAELARCLHGWQDDELELKEEFKARIETSECEMRQGKRPRLRQP